MSLVSLQLMDKGLAVQKKTQVRISGSDERASKIVIDE